MIGNVLMFSSGGASEGLVKAFLWGTLVRHDSSIIIGGADTAMSTAYAEAEYFTYSSGVFTCQTAGTYSFTVFGRGGNASSSGTARNISWSIYVNGTQDPSTAQSGVTTAGRLSTVSLTLSANDTVSLYANMNGASVTGDVGMEVELA